MNFKIHILALITIAAISVSCEQHLSNQEVSCMSVFKSLWTIIDEKYCYIEDKGVDWQDVYNEYETKISRIPEGEEIALFDTLSLMLDKLKDGHVNLYTPFDISVSTGWLTPYPTNFNSTILYSRYLTDYRSVNGLQYTKLKDNIGYIRYSSFQDIFSAANMRYILQEFAQTDGIILDVRSNGGGSIEQALLLASTFFTENTVIGYMQHKTGKEHNAFSDPQAIEVEANAMPYKYNGKVVVLSNRRSYSATNLFLLAIKSCRQATIVGGRSGGGGGIPLSYELPNGWMIRFSSVRMTDMSGQSIEDGIEPHYLVNLTDSDKDDIIEYAISLIEKK